MIRVRFARPYGIWNAGEVAGFTAAYAEQLIAQGTAIEVAAEAKAKDEAEAPAKAKAEKPAKGG